MNDQVYTPAEIVRMTIQAKQKAIDLYLLLARNSENYHVGRLFTELAKRGQKNKLALEKVFNTLNEDVKDEAYPGEKSLYLKALVDSKAFICDETEKKALEKTINEEEALQAGISFKKDLLLFLHEIRGQATEEGMETVDDLIQQEIASIREIFDIKDTISGQ